MSAAAGEMTLNVSQLNQIGGLLREVNPDGSANNAATQQLLAQVLQQMGSNFTQTTVSDNLHSNFVAEGGFGVQQVAAMVAAIAASIVTAGAALAAMGATLATMTVGEAMVVGLASGMMGSLVSQVISGNGVNFGAVLEAGAISGLTAGAFAELGVGTQALQQFGTKLASNIGSVTLSDVGNVVGEIAERGIVTAGVETAVEGGSFGRALEGSVIADVGAVGAFAIGAASTDSGSLLAEKSPGYVLAHAALGCALSAAQGEGCAGGAIGGAASALVAPVIRDDLYGGTQTVTYTDNGDGTLIQTISYDNSAFNALTAGIATLTGGLAAGLGGANAQAGATSAENEVLNNTLSEKEELKDTQRVTVPLEQQFGGSQGSSNDPSTGVEVATVGTGALAAGLAGANQGAGTNASSGSTTMINGVTVVDQRTGTVYQGTADLQPTLTRIASGGDALSKNDGTVFQNRPVNGVQLLPAKPPGYYTEYVVPTTGINGPGPQRVVTGQGGELYYTPDHYQTFIPVKK